MKAGKRKKLKKRDFAYPKARKYPIDTKARAKNALARAAQSGTSGSYEHVAKAVRAKYGDAVASVGRKKGTTGGPGYRK